MKKPIPFPRHLNAEPVPLASAAVHSLMALLPSGTAFCIGVVLVVMMSGRLGYHKGRLTRAVLPFGGLCTGAGTTSNGPWSAA